MVTTAGRAQGQVSRPPSTSAGHCLLPPPPPLRRRWPAAGQQRGQHLAGLVAVVVDGLFAQDDELGLFLCRPGPLRSLATARGCSSASVSTRMARSAPMAMAVRRVSWHWATPHGDGDDFGGDAFFFQAHGLFQRRFRRKGSCSSRELSRCNPRPASPRRVPSMRRFSVLQLDVYVNRHSKRGCTGHGTWAVPPFAALDWRTGSLLERRRLFYEPGDIPAAAVYPVAHPCGLCEPHLMAIWLCLASDRSCCRPAPWSLPGLFPGSSAASAPHRKLCSRPAALRPAPSVG